MKALPFAIAAAPIALATPAVAQDHSMHNMPGMTMPAKPAAKPQAKPVAKPRPPARAKAKPAPAAPKRASPAPAAADPHAGHDMSGMAMPTAPAQADPHAGHAMSDSPATTAPPDPHAGHDMSGMTGEMSQNMGTGGTALPPGNAPAPVAPEPSYADRVYSPERMAAARAYLRNEHGGYNFWQVNFNLAEVQIRDGDDSFRWDGEGWYGGDINRLVIRTEGEGEFGRGVEDAEVQALYSRSVGPYTFFQAGVRYDFKPNPSRTYLSVGVESLVPYWFDVEATAFLSDKGDVLGRLEGFYDQRITQRLILQPRAELNFAAQDVPENGIGSGLSDIELGLRLRYEIKREFAPYIGVSYDRRLGNSARFARAEGESVGGPSFVVGVRTWF